MPPCFVLLTDFGLDDPYVGQMKGGLLRRVPGACILDISHGVRPHDILQGAFFLAATLPHLPQDIVCLAVVDPGVGTSRKIVCIEQDHRFVLAPDNGLASLVVERPLPTAAWDLTPLQTPPHTSATFHGRDLFVPLAASLARGTSPSELGTVLDVGSVHRLPDLAPRLDGGRLTTTVLHVDRFGNCILNLPTSQWAGRLQRHAAVSMLEPRHVRMVPVNAYADLPAGGIGLLAGSQGYLELAMNRRSAAVELGLVPGETCVFELTD